MATPNVYDKLKALGIELPNAATPAAAYVMSVQTGNTVFLSGHTAKKDGKPWVGKLGATMTTEEGKVAARSVAVDLIDHKTQREHAQTDQQPRQDRQTFAQHQALPQRTQDSGDEQHVARRHVRRDADLIDRRECEAEREQPSGQAARQGDGAAETVHDPHGAPEVGRLAQRQAVSTMSSRRSQFAANSVHRCCRVAAAPAWRESAATPPW